MIEDAMMQIKNEKLILSKIQSLIKCFSDCYSSIDPRLKRIEMESLKKIYIMIIKVEMRFHQSKKLIS